MEYAYAVLLLDESGKELNEENITAVLEAAGVPIEESRVKALVAALEDVPLGRFGGAAEPGDDGSSILESVVGSDGESAPDATDGEAADDATDGEPATDGAEGATGGESSQPDSTATE